MVDLRHKLESKHDEITKRYASYVSCLCDCVKKKGVTSHELRTYLFNLRALKSDQCKTRLSGLKMEPGENGIHQIFDILSNEVASFLNYDIFKCIAQEYCSDLNLDHLKYCDYLKTYIDQHKIALSLI